MKRFKITVFQMVVVGILIALIVVNVLFFLRQPRIGYVRSYELVDQYHGTIEARSDFEKKKSAMTMNIDSLRSDFEQARNRYFEVAGKLTSVQRTEQEEVLTQQHNQLLQYREAIEKKIQEEDSKMTQEVLNQINSFVEDYAQRNGYEIVLGTTTSGSLLYGDRSMDITKELLEDLNKNYQGK